MADEKSVEPVVKLVKKLWFDRTPDDFYRLMVLDLLVLIVGYSV